MFHGIWGCQEWLELNGGADPCPINRPDFAPQKKLAGGNWVPKRAKQKYQKAKPLVCRFEPAPVDRCLKPLWTVSIPASARSLPTALSSALSLDQFAQNRRCCLSQPDYPIGSDIFRNEFSRKPKSSPQADFSGDKKLKTKDCHNGILDAVSTFQFLLAWTPTNLLHQMKS
jgi:hypothetical protein